MKYSITKGKTKMKNVIKRISAVAMAFTLLGTGTVITKKISPKSYNTLTASAACSHNCRYYSSYSPVGDYIFEYAVCSNCNKRMYLIRVLPRWQ